MIIIILVIIIIVIVFYYLINNNKQTEHFWDLVPYEYRWNIFKCYNGKCTVGNSFKYAQFCNYIEDEGAREYCRQKSLDDADLQFDSLKLNKVNFGPEMPWLRCASLLRNTHDYVLWTGFPSKNSCFARDRVLLDSGQSGIEGARG
jgi:hypothetical protein